MTVEFHIGIDDTDSPNGGCTTYTMALIVEELKARGFTIDGYPCLVRLNPNVPWKTRGNAALALHVKAPESRLDEARYVTTEIVKETSRPYEAKTDPAIVFLQGPVPDALHEFYQEALAEIVPVEKSIELASSIGAEALFLKGPQGIVGALASIGAHLDANDHTYEVIAYRTKENLGTKRRIEPDSVTDMDAKTRERTYNNLDPETGRILIAPHGPDPVLFGIRGQDPEGVMEAFRIVRVNEPIERLALFKTNQGTDAHLLRPRKISSLQSHQSGNITGEVSSAPEVLRGGHVFFQMTQDGERVDCAAFQPTGSFRQTILQLIPGDLVRAYGGVRPSRRKEKWLLNLEKLEVMSLAEVTGSKLPNCRNCGGTLESMGRGQGLRCRKCRLKISINSSPRIVFKLRRSLARGVYLPPAGAHRHLTKPATRPIDS